MRVPMIGGSEKSLAVEVSAEQTVNWYPEIHPGYKYAGALYGRPGLATWANAGSAENRGMIVFGSNLFIVVGADFKQVTTSGTVTTLGTISTSAGPVSMAANLTQIMLVDGVDGYIWNGTTFAVIADADFPNTCTHVVHLDGYFVVNDTSNAGRFYISTKNDGTGWDATEFSTAERDPDALSAMVVDHRELWLFGATTTEVWFNSGNADFPFDPIPSGFTEWGIAAKHSAAKLPSLTGPEGGSICWLAAGDEGEGVVMQSFGFRGQRVSTHGIEHRIAQLSTISDAIGWGMQWKGHVWYFLTFPTGNLTLVYDTTTQLWHEWKTYNLGRFTGNSHAFFNGNHVVGDYQDGNIFQLSDTQYSDAGTEIEHIRIDRAIANTDTRGALFHYYLEVEFESGVGNSDEDDPLVMMQYSDDGGHTYSTELTRNLGKIGEYGKRQIWRSLGRSRDRTYMLKVTDPVRCNLVGAWLDLGIGLR